LKIKELYELAIKKGIEQDPRGKERVAQELKRIKKQYEKLSLKDKEEFDVERLSNPYSDTRILCGDANKQVKTVLIGIDIDPSEILLAERLADKGKKIDLVISHHPEGKALAALHQVMSMQTDIVNLRGVPIRIAEDLLSKRIGEVERKLLPVNHTKTIDTARLLNVALVCIHTPADNHVTSFLQRLMNKRKPETVGEIVDILKSVPEYKQAVKNNAGPKIINGTDSARCGKVFVDMTGGTEGSKEIFKNLAQAGVGTIIGMHLSEEHLKKAKAEHINIVIAGHISSDTLGLNLLLDGIEKKQKLDIISCAGFNRIRRK